MTSLLALRRSSSLDTTFLLVLNTQVRRHSGLRGRGHTHCFCQRLTARLPECHANCDKDMQQSNSEAFVHL